VHWLGLVIVTVVVAAAQTTIGSRMAIKGVAPSFLLVTAVYYGFRWPTAAAGIAGWTLGLAGDLTSLGQIGAQSLSLAVVAMAASRLRSVLMTDRPAAQILTTGVLGWMAYSLILAYGAWRLGSTGWSFGASLRTAGYYALYSAVLAPYLFWLLERAVPMLGLQPQARRR
jgi:rod shape-determining protein MreD